MGELELTGEDEAAVDAYFAADFVFHGPDGAELNHEGLKGHFESLRAAFDDLTISRGIVVVEGDYVACQTTITGTFAREFTHSPVGPIPPHGSHVVFELVNIFRHDDQGRPRRNGCRRTTAAGCATWVRTGADDIPRRVLLSMPAPARAKRW